MPAAKTLLSLLILCFAVRAAGVPAQGYRIMYAGASPYGAEIARDIFEKGGNVVDVAVAVALSQAVTHPYYSSFGGGGFAVVKINGEIKALDFREVAPGKANTSTYKELDAKASRDGSLAVAVPGNPAGYWELHKKYGKLKWSALFEAAIRLAEKGFRVSGEWVNQTARSKDRFSSAGKKIFFNGDRPLKPGELLKQPQLAAFLKELRGKGASAFYAGKTAADIVATVNAGGKGLFTLDDLKNYKVRWLEPIAIDFFGYKLHSMPPPSSGGLIVAQAARLLEKLKIQETKPLSVDELHLLIETMKLAFRGRQLLGDPDFAKLPVAQLLSDKYLSEMAALVKPDKAIDVAPLEDLHFKESESTTHFSVMDAQGSAVAMTITLNGDYGSGLVTPVTGIALNNEMDDFTTRLGQPNMFGLIQGEANQVRAGARPLSSMTPTIAEKNGRTVMALGAPGGPRIITAVLQAAYRGLTQSFDMDQAIQAPRVHHQFLPNSVKVDTLRFPPETIAALEKRGHKVETANSTGRVFGIRLSEDGILSGAGDARGESSAGGM